MVRACRWHVYWRSVGRFAALCGTERGQIEAWIQWNGELCNLIEKSLEGD